MKSFKLRTLIAAGALCTALGATVMNSRALAQSGAVASAPPTPDTSAAAEEISDDDRRAAMPGSAQSEQRDDAVPSLLGRESESLTADERSGIINILIIGTDELLPDSDDLGRGDVTMLCSLDRTSGDVKLVSFERSTAVPWQGHGDVMLTNSFTYGGAELTTDCVRSCFRVDIAGYIHFDFQSFCEVIDALGGVDIDLTREEAEALTEDTYTEVWFSEGTNHLDGAGALRYCRLRRIDDNWQRVERQRKTVQAVLSATRSLRLSQICELAEAVLPMIDTDLSTRQLASILLTAPKFVGAQAEQMTIPDRERIYVHDGYDEDVTGCDYKYESDRLNRFLYGDEE